jgi:hypothetical protein
MEVLNPQVHFSTINRIRCNAIVNWVETDWLTLVEVLKSEGHTVSEDKDVMCISPWLYKTLEQGATKRMTDDGQLWTIDDEPVVARLADNVIGTDLLMFDFDATISVEMAKSTFADYPHFGYTSYSHMSMKKDHKDCFRVMVPLAKFVTAEDLVKRRNTIYKQFQGVDISCLSLARSFYVPSCPPDKKVVAHMWDNHGTNIFDVYDYEPEQEYVAPAFKPAAVNRPVDKQRIIEGLKTIYVGHEPTWFNVAVAMASNQFTVEDFKEVTIGGLMKEKTVRDCEVKWRAAERRVEKGKGMTVGYLVNLCKKHNVDVKTPYQTTKETGRANMLKAVEEMRNGNK